MDAVNATAALCKASRAARAARADVDALLASVDRLETRAASAVAPRLRSMEAVEKEHILGVVEATGTIEKASDVLGLSRATLYRKLASWKERS